MWHERTSPLDPNSPNRIREKEKESENGEWIFKERESTFSLEFPVIRPSNSDEARSKVGPQGKSYAWISIL